ncbi:unnamed protein product [Paramecium sonneborni]|uniref:HECT domain-containing protein n=1 Tax=Paramecium sonneborni TaxID=65129 RepID=A0A8S1P314_9CILI|nr:unnamed protein product [Paramecium sonneborni]
MRFQLKVPNQLSEEEAQMITIIDSFDLEELRDQFDKNYFLFSQSDYLTQYLLNKIDSSLENIITEIQNNTKFDCSQILIFIKQIKKKDFLINEIFQSYEHLIKIVEYTDNLFIYGLILEVIDFRIMNAIRHNSLPRLIYLVSILHQHNNYLSSQKIDLIDYYHEDPKYKTIVTNPIEALQFEIEYNEPTQLDESYEEISKNQMHKKRLLGQFQTKKIQIIDDNSTSALSLSRNLLNMPDQPFSPLIEIVKYRILIKRGLLTNPEQTKNIIIKLHLQCNSIIQNYQNRYQDLQMNQLLRNLKLTENFNLFKLNTVNPLVLQQLMETSQNYYQDQLNQDRQEQYFTLLSDVLQVKHVEQNELIQGYPLKYNTQIMNEQLARNGLVFKSILDFFQSQNCHFLLNQYQYFNQICRLVKGSLCIQDNRLLLPPEQFQNAIKFLSYLSRQYYEQQSNYQTFDELVRIAEYYINLGLNLLKPTENGYAQICETDADIIIESCIEAITINNQHNMIAQNNSVFARKVINSRVLSLIANYLQQKVQLNNIFDKALRLISFLSQTEPQLMIQILNSTLPDILNENIQKNNINELKMPRLSFISLFYRNICQQEQARQKFNDHGINIIDKLLNYHFFVKEVINLSDISNLAFFIREYTHYIQQSRAQINEILIKVLQQLLQQLSEQLQQLNYDQNFKSQYQKILHKRKAIQNFSQIINQHNSGFSNILHSQGGYFDNFVRLFKIPQFKRMFIHQFGLNQFENFDPNKCLISALELIEQLEQELGCTLEQSQSLVFNEKNFYQNCSPQTFQMTSRLSEILDYFIVVQNNINRLKLTNQNLTDKLIDKYCAFLEIFLTSQSEQKYFSHRFDEIIIQVQNRKGSGVNLQPLSRLLNRLSLQLNNPPEIALYYLKQILQFIVRQKKNSNFIINSDVGRNLQYILKTYVVMINSDSSNSELEDDLLLTIESILRFLYNLSGPSMDQNLSIFSKIIEEISTLLQIIKDSSHQKITIIQGILLNQVNHILLYNPSNSSQRNNPIYPLERTSLVDQLNSIGFQRRYINQILDIFPFLNTVNQFCDFEELRRFELEGMGIIQNTEEQEIIQNVGEIQSQESFDIELFKTQQETLKKYLKQNYLYFQKNLQIQQKSFQIQLNEPEILKYLELIVDKLFNLKLNFQVIELDLQIPHNVNINSLSLILTTFNRQNQFTISQELLKIELFKLFEFLLQQGNQEGLYTIYLILEIFFKLQIDQKEILDLLFNGIKKILDSNIQNSNTTQIIIQILVNIFKKNRQFVSHFLLQMKGLEQIFKMKGEGNNQFISLSKLTMLMIYDQTLIRAQIEAKIKKIIFDQKNNEQIEKTNQNLQQQQYKNENAYPICVQPAQYNVQIQEQQKISKNHPGLLALQNEQYFQTDLKYVMDLLFEEQTDNQSLILKNGIRLDTLNSINKNEEPILQFNFKHSKETQTLLKLLVQQMVTSYFEKNEYYQYDWNNIFNVLQILIQKFPILLPGLTRMNCSQFLEKYKDQLGLDPSQKISNISFLTLITKFINPSKNFIFYMCLDNIVLFGRSDNVIVPFAYEIRRMIIRELFVGINKSINNLDEKVCQFSDILVTLLQIKSVSKICIKNIHEPQNSFNFIQTFIEGIKNFNIKQYFKQKDQLFFIMTTLNLLYGVATNLLLEKTEPILDYRKEQMPTKQLNFLGKPIIDYMKEQMPTKQLNIIGEMSSVQINNQIFQSYIKTLANYQNYNLINNTKFLQQWPYLKIKNEILEENTNIQKEQVIPNDQLIQIQHYDNSFENLVIKLEEESINWINENQNENMTENLQQTDLNNQNILINFINNFINNQLFSDSIISNLSLNGTRLPRQFQKYLINFKVRQQQESDKALQNNLQNNNNYFDLIQNPRRPRDRNVLMHMMLQPNQNNFSRFELNPNMLDLPNPRNMYNQDRNADDLENSLSSIQEINHDSNIEGNLNQEISTQEQQPQDESNQYFGQHLEEDNNQFMQKLDNYANLVLNNRQQTLQLLGSIDQQFLQFLLKLMQVEDDEDRDYRNILFIRLGASSTLANQLIDALICKLRMISNNVSEDNFVQENFLVQKNVIINDNNYFQNIVKNQIIKILLKLSKSLKCKLSQQTFQYMMDLIFSLEREKFQLFLQVFINFSKDQQNVYELKPNQARQLFNRFFQENSLSKINKQFIQLISNLWKNRDSAFRFDILIQENIQTAAQYFENRLLDLQFNDLIINKRNQITKAFELIQYTYINVMDNNQQEACQKFLEKPENIKLWQNLQKVISNLQVQQFQEYSLLLLPYIQSFLICNQIFNENEAQNIQIYKISSMEISRPSIEDDFDYEQLFKKLCKHGQFFINYIIKEQLQNFQLINQIKNNNQHFIVYFFKNHANIIDLENKKAYLRIQISNLRRNNNFQQQEPYYFFIPELEISVHRENVFMDSYQQVSRFTKKQLQDIWMINFIGEQGQDAGGPTREWFALISKEILNPIHGLFIPAPNQQYYQINREAFDTNHLNKFRFVGKIFAKAITQKVYIFGNFPSFFFKHILGSKLSIRDIQDYDEGLYNSMNYIYQDEITSNFDFSFTYTMVDQGIPKEKELIPGGENIQVTHENRKDYVKKYCHQIMAKNIEAQIKAIQEGFYSIIPKDIIAIFDPTQFQQLLCGKEIIEVEDLIQNMECKGIPTDHQANKWLQNLLRSFSQDMLAKFLKFVTGSPLSPAGGFGNLTRKIIISYYFESQDNLPEGHTCSLTISLPVYASEDVLREKMETALTEGNEQFTIA